MLAGDDVYVPAPFESLDRSVPTLEADIRLSTRLCERDEADE